MLDVWSLFRVASTDSLSFVLCIYLKTLVSTCDLRGSNTPNRLERVGPGNHVLVVVDFDMGLVGGV